MRRQLTFFDLCEDFADSTLSRQLNLLSKHLDLSEIIPPQTRNSYRKWTGRPPYPLESMFLALLIQKLLSIPSVDTLVALLNFSREIRTFCGFTDSVPDAATFCRFKQKLDWKPILDRLVQLTDSISQEIDPEAANVLVYDTTGLEVYVKENNPKFQANLERKLRKLHPDKSDEELIPMARRMMPKSAASEEAAKLSYVNNHFAYSYKAGILLNGLGLIRSVGLFEATVADVDTLKPVLDHFMNQVEHKPHALVADSAFDSVEIYRYLFEDHELKPIINLNPRNSSDLPEPNQLCGVPTCPKDPNLPFKPDGYCKKRKRYKWICPKSRKTKRGYVLSCDDPCTPSKCGRIVYTYPNHNYRMNPPVPKGSELWKKLYAFRIFSEHAISRLKLPLELGRLNIRQKRTVNAELHLATITHLVVALIAYRAHRKDKIRSIRTFAA